MRNVSSVLHSLRSKRALIAMAGAAAAAVNLVNTVGTQAATQDVATANASQVATQNFYPVPVAPSIACSTSGSSGSQRITLTWGSAGPNVKYSVEEYLNNTGSAYYTTTTTGTSFGPWHDQSVSDAGSGWAQSVRMRVYSINTITNEKSTGYISFTAYEASYYSTRCSGDAFPQENVSNWQQQGSWTPGAQAMRSAQTLGAAGEQARNAPPASDATTTTTTATPMPGLSTSQSTTLPSATTSSTGTTTSAPKTTPPTTSAPTTTTTAPSTTTSTTPTTTTTTSSTAASSTSAH